MCVLLTVSPLSLTLSAQAFCVSGPIVWNSLPNSCKQAELVTASKCKLKSKLFYLAYGEQPTVYSRLVIATKRLWFAFDVRCCINLQLIDWLIGPLVLSEKRCSIVASPGPAEWHCESTKTQVSTASSPYLSPSETHCTASIKPQVLIASSPDISACHQPYCRV